MHPPYRSFPTGPMFLRTLPIRFTLLGVILPGELRPACSSSPGFHNKCRYRRSLSADGRVRFSLSALSVSRREILNPTAPACIGVSSSRFSLSPHRSPSEAAETIGLDPSMFIRRYRANVSQRVRCRYHQSIKTNSAFSHKCRSSRPRFEPHVKVNKQR